MIRLRRSHLDIMGDLVKACPASTMVLMVAANCSYESFQKYKGCLVGAGFLTGPKHDGSRRIYSATRRGLEFVSRLDNALGMLDGVVETRF